MSITDEGHYGPKQLNLLKTVWGEGFLSPGGTDEIDEVMKGIDASGKTVLDIGLWMWRSCNTSYQKPQCKISIGNGY